jgi:hypothetical protein
MQQKYYEKQIDIGSPEQYYWNRIEDDPRQPKWQEQQNKYGFDERETWSLDFTFIAWVYPRLKMYREINAGYPMGITKKQWNKIIDEMIEGFELYLKTDNLYNKEANEKLERSLDLFREYIRTIWW